jgi:hypothetical protein
LIPDRTFRENRAYLKKDEHLAQRLYAHGAALNGLWTRFRKLIDNNIIELSLDSDSSTTAPAGQLTAAYSLASIAPSDGITPSEAPESPCASSPAPLAEEVQVVQQHVAVPIQLPPAEGVSLAFHIYDACKWA